MIRAALLAGAACLALGAHMAGSGDAHAAPGLQSPDPTAAASGIPAMVRLRIEPQAEGAHVLVDNLLAGPIEVLVRAEGAAPPSDPPLPARGTIPAHSAALLARVGHGAPRLSLEVVPGTPNARPRDVEYAWPLAGTALRVQQAWGGHYSHADDANRHAVDFAAPQGTPVLAARDGVVMLAEAGFADPPPGDDAALHEDRANFIRILHDDGSMALYAHLQAGGVRVRNGQQVRRGEQIGLSGNTGRSSAPHLHFVVQVNRGLRLASLPFRMFGPQGVLRFDHAQSGGD